MSLGQPAISQKCKIEPISCASRMIARSTEPHNCQTDRRSAAAGAEIWARTADDRLIRNGHQASIGRHERFNPVVANHEHILDLKSP